MKINGFSAVLYTVACCFFLRSIFHGNTLVSRMHGIQIYGMFCNFVSQMLSVRVKYLHYHCADINSPTLAHKNENKCPHASYTLKYEGSTQGPCDVDSAHKPRPHCVKTWAGIKDFSVRIQTQLSLKLLDEHWQTFPHIFYQCYCYSFIMQLSKTKVSSALH